MKITHLQSSTQIIQLGNITILTDPWLTDGEYYGSWYHYPPFPKGQLATLDYDYIYVSHIHPDHLSEDTFKNLPKRTPVLIHNYQSKFVKRKLEMLGFEVIECDHGKPFVFENGGSITIYAADNCNPELCNKFMGCAPVETKFGSTQIDTMAIFRYEDQVILNTNDCPFELAEATIKENKLNELKVDVLLLGYAGAGPYPQCFDFESLDDKLVAAEAKQMQFLTQSIKYIELVQPEMYVPFAGTYILGSRLAALNEFRGVPSLDEALDFLHTKVSTKHKGIVLKQFDVLDVSNSTKTAGNIDFKKSYQEYINEISQHTLSYDNDSWEDDELTDLFNRAYNRFKEKAIHIGFASNTTLIIESDKIAYQLSVNSEPRVIIDESIVSEPYLKIIVDHNLLHRLLRGPKYAHWNNAEIGSHLHFIRKPDVFERALYHCLCFLHA